MKHSILTVMVNVIALSLLGVLFFTGIPFLNGPLPNGAFLNDALAQTALSPQSPPLPSQQVSATQDTRLEQVLRIPAEAREDGNPTLSLNAPLTQNVDLVGQIDFDSVDPVYSVAVQGDYAYAGLGNRLAILNVADPAHPTLVGQTPIPDIARELIVSGTYAYVAAGDSGLRIIDVSSPASPTEVGFYNTPNSATTVAISGTHAYIADLVSLHIIDVSDPVHPAETGSYEGDYVPGWMDITVSGSYVYVASEYEGLHILDVSNPASPTRVSRISVDAAFYQGGGLLGDYAYMVAVSYQTTPYQTVMHIFDVSNPLGPTEVASYPVPGVLRRIASTRAYFASDDDKLHIWDVSNPLNPTGISSYQMHDYLADVMVSGTHVYVDGGMNGLRILDVSDPTQPVEVGYYATLAPHRIAVAGTHAYVAAKWTGLHVFDVSDSAKPTEIGFHALPETAPSIAVSGDYAYVGGQNGLRTFDVSDPFGPTQVGSLDTSYISDMAVSGPYAYAITGDKMRIIDISNPANPAPLGSFSVLEGTPLAVSGTYAYMIFGYPRVLDIVDVSDPTSPTLVSSLNLDYASSSSVVAAGSFVYISDDEGLHIVDVSNPASPSLTASYDLPGASVTVSGVYAYVAQENSLYVIDVSNPANPSPVGLYDAPWPINDVAPSGPYVYVIGDNGLAILRFRPPSISGRVLDYDGNPMPGIRIATSSRITLTTDASGRYTLTNLLAGTYVFTPVTPGYLWVPPSHSIALSLDMPEPDFVGHAALKQTPSSVVAYGDVLTYTLRVVALSDRNVALYDRLPEYTTYLSDSLAAPAGVRYDPAHNAISGTLSLAAAIPLSVSYAVRVGQDGSVGATPLVTNTAILTGLVNGRTLLATAVVNVSFPPLGEWRITIVDSQANMDTQPYSSLALDGSGRPHISYSDAYPNYTLKYAWHDGSTWHIEIVDSEGGWDSSLALDDEGHPHISYYSDNGLDYAWYDGASWLTETVDSQEGLHTSLALDDAGRPHISYSSYSGLKYAWHDGSAWHIETVASEGGWDSSLALDDEGRPHISYSDHTYSKYAWHDGNAWHVETVDSEGGLGSSLALDDAGQPHISYLSLYYWCNGRICGYSPDGLKYAWREAAATETAATETVGREATGHDGARWLTETVDSQESLYTSLALDDAGRPHISYSSYSGLKYAWHDDNAWRVETVDSEGQVGEGISLALDDAGQPHISYNDFGYLKYVSYEPFLLLKMQAAPDGEVYNHQLLTYTLVLSGAGANARLWAPLPGSLRYITGSLSGNLTPPAVYSSTAHAIIWQGELPADRDPEIRFQTVVNVQGNGSPFETPAIANTAWLIDTDSGRTISATARLTVIFSPLQLDKQATPADGVLNRDVVTYTLTLSGTGQNATLWDPLPAGVRYALGSLSSTLSPLPVYSPTLQAITWAGVLPADAPGQVRFQVTRGITGPGSLDLSLPIVNTAWLTDTDDGTHVEAIAIVNGPRLYLPFVMR